MLQRDAPPWYAFCHNDLQYGNMMLFYRQLSASTPSPAAAATIVGRYDTVMLHVDVCV